jgi:hypothetical protein
VGGKRGLAVREPGQGNPASVARTERQAEESRGELAVVQPWESAETIQRVRSKAVPMNRSATGSSLFPGATAIAPGRQGHSNRKVSSALKRVPNGKARDLDYGATLPSSVNNLCQTC